MDWDFGRCDADSWAKNALPLKCVMCMTTLGNRPGSCFSATADIAAAHVGLLQLLLGGPLRVAPGALLVVYAPSPHRTTAHAMPTQRSRSSTPHANRCPTSGIRAEFSSPPFPIPPNPQDRMPSPTRSTTPRHPSHVGFSQTCAVPLDTPTPCFSNRKWAAKEPLEGKRGALAPFRFSQTRVRAMAVIHRHWPINDPPAFVSGVLP